MAVSTIKQFTQLPKAYHVVSRDDHIVIYGVASLVGRQRVSLFVFVNNQGGQLFFIHVFTGQYGNELTARWLINDYTETLTPRVDGNNIVIDCSGNLLSSAWGNGLAITN